MSMKTLWTWCGIAMFVLTAIEACRAQNSTILGSNSLGIGADPSVAMIKESSGSYFYTAITGNVPASGATTATTMQLQIYRSQSIAGLMTSDSHILTIDPKALNSSSGGAAVFNASDGLWAPYIYQDPGGIVTIYVYDKTAQKMIVLRSSGNSSGDIWDNPFSAQPLNLPSSWTLASGYDWSVIPWNGHLWGFFALHASGSTNQGIWVVQMQDGDPTTVSGTPQQISQFNYWSSGNSQGSITPGPAWETLDNGNGGCNEAPQPFIVTQGSNTALFVNYSGNYWGRDDYSLGLLRFTGTPSDNLNNPSLWYKLAQPVFQKTARIVGPGSNAVVQDRFGTLWNVYGARDSAIGAPNNYVPTPPNTGSDTATTGREIRAQQISLAGVDITKTDYDNEVPYYGTPFNEGFNFIDPTSSSCPSSFLCPSSNPSVSTASFPYSTPNIFYSAPRNAATGWSESQDESATMNSSFGAYVLIRFYGTSVTVYGNQSQNGGSASVYLGGETSLQPANFSGSGTNVQVFQKTGLTNGQHSLLIVNDNPSGSSTVSPATIAITQIQTTWTQPK